MAGVFWGGYLVGVCAPGPVRENGRELLIMTAGVVLGFPLCTSVALEHVEAVHASAIQGALPLFTAVLGALLNRQRPSLGFWVCASLGSALVIGYALLKGGPSAWVIHPADALLLLGMLLASLGYVWGARLAGRRPPRPVNTSDSADVPPPVRLAVVRHTQLTHT